MADIQYTKNRKPLRVVIASPRDVLAERALAWEAIEQANKMLSDMDKQYYLEPVDDSTTVPDGKIPQTVAAEHLKIESSDFFICILGHRLGSSPGTRRPSDGTLYFSGTEEEFEVAYNASRKHSNGRPRIMLYRKSNALPTDMSDDDYLQYGRLLEFIRDCSPTGRHPTYVYNFNTSDFKQILSSHLLQACRTIEKQETEFRADINDWYGKIGLQENPFFGDLFSRGFPEEYTIPFAGIDWQQYRNLFETIHPIYIFGERGSGKSTLREMLRLKVKQSHYDDRTFLCSLQSENFDNFIDRAGDNLPNFKDWGFAYMIFDNVVNALVGGAKVSSQPGLMNIHSASKTLHDLMSWLHVNTDYRRLLILVDEIDEIKLVKDSSQPFETAFELFRQLVILPQTDNILIRYFLPARMENLMLAEPDRFRLDKYPPIYLYWNDNKMLELIEQRMSAASNPKGRYKSLRQIYSGPQTSKSIDLEMVQMAEHNPRALLWLASHLLEVHTNPSVTDEIPDFILLSSWEQVKFDWQTQRTRFFPTRSATTTSPFKVLPDGIIFRDNEYHLSRIHARLMACLNKAYGTYCDREILKKAGWPDDQVPPSDKNYEETMRQLRKVVETFAPGWLVNKRGSGYRLYDPQSDRRQ